RLLFEAQTLALSQLRLQITEPEAASKRVPEAERDRRMTLLRAELTGLSIEGPLEPGRKLLDECAHQEATGQLKYLAPDRCVSRLHEVTNAKNTSRQVEIDQSKLIVREAQDELSMPASSALQVQEALRRRGLAYTFAQALSWSAYDKYLMRLFSHMHREPPPNHNRVSVTQLVEADRLVFVKLIEQNIKPKRDASGSFPLDDALHQALESYEVSFALMHLQSKQAPPRDPTRPPFKKLKTQHDEANITKPGGKWKGKDKKGTGKSTPWVSIPKFIRDRGGHAATPSGDPICFTYSRILVGFTVKGFEASPPKLIQALQQAQFALPDIGTADIFRATSSAPDFQVGLELFSGLGRLTSHLRAHGYPGSLAVDVLRSSSAASVAHSLDVVHAAPLICEWLQSPYVAILHIAPPFFVEAPLAMAIAAIVDTAVACGQVVSFELPGTSPFWSTPTGQRVCQHCPHVVSFDLCCFGADPVSTRIASNSTCFQALSRPCKCHHAKLPPETCDRVYSWNFAVRFASCLKSSNAVRPAQDFSAKAATLSQPKSSKFPAMVSEHQQVVLTHGTADWPIPCMARLKSPLTLPPSVTSELRTLPSGAQLLRVTPCNSAKGGGDSEFVSAWGIPRSPDEFVKAAESEAAFKKSMELMEEYGYPDKEVFDEVSLGSLRVGTVAAGEERNKSWARGPLSRDELASDSLVSRAYDLRSAYRQLPIHPSSLKHALVSHWNPEQCAVEIDQLLALPFGAARSAYGFLRAAASVWWLGCTCLGLMWSVFYDDFVTLARTRDVRHTDAAATTFFHLLGWQFDECGEKAFEFSRVFKALGVLFDLNDAHVGRVLIKNTPSRIDELCQLITQIVDSRTLSRAAAQRLRGRMQFCDGFLFGRASRLCLKAVTRHIHSTCDDVQGDELWESLLRFRDCLRASRPHVVVANHQEPLYLFTDACYEPQDLFRNRPLVCHLDNNTARDIAISGKGRSPIAHALVTALLTLEDAGEIRCWYTRVPSPSNVADEPSRRLCRSLVV
ncbi:unnamed protein product, partial [Symbiodinium necroappetens]